MGSVVVLVKRTFARHFGGRWLLHLVDFKECIQLS
ncbi:hypothetical protein Golob_021827 [Gossypium lobatum]|uniref:Uncharacterized protein n=1 Tax=Gossypium lobatum TaxID=34289 RepID=A0A7J8LEW1_9ROSI|nr:hypothetical protein [Gossypium lobatum]